MQLKFIKGLGFVLLVIHRKMVGYGRALMEYCLADAKEKGKSGVCMLGAKKQKAKELPCVFNNWGVFYKGHFETVNLLDVGSLERILKKG